MGEVFLPHGFRFHPTDEELVRYYLQRKNYGIETALEVIPVIDFYKFDPWELPEKSFLPKSNKEWFFFCPRDKKYPNGSCTNRATKSGCWKATGKDRKVVCGSAVIGFQKTLVFYRGRAPLGDRTDWVMHEYRLCDNVSQTIPVLQGPFALCRIIKKNEQKTKDGEASFKPVGSSSQSGNVASVVVSNEPMVITQDTPIQASHICTRSNYSTPITFPYQPTKMGACDQPSTYSSMETNQVNGCAEQNVGVTSPPRSKTSLFGAKIVSSQVRGVRQPDSSCQQPVKENGIAKQIIGARSPPRIGSLGVIARQADQPPQQSMPQVDEVNKEYVASGELDEATGSRKQAKVRTLDTEYGITREVLEQHSGKKLKDVEVILGVSRSTLKRICRKCGIYRWPPSKVKRPNHQEFVRVTRRSIEESSQRMQPVSDVVLWETLENVSASQMQTTPEAKSTQDDSSIMVKATCKDDIIKFHLLLASRKLDLENEVAKRLNLSVGSFKIKYLDEDGDWVLIACDADLKTCISTLTSLGKTTVRMLID